MTESEALQYLAQAKQYYADANLSQALASAQKAYLFYESMTNNMQALDVFTLLQTIYAYMQCPDECLTLESSIYGSVQALFTENSDQLYSMHLLDLVSQLLHMEQTESAISYLQSALTIMKQTGIPDTELLFLEDCFQAQICFINEQYHAAHMHASKADSLWESCSNSNMDTYGIQNLLLLCSINAKLNHPVESIEFLENLLMQNFLNPYQVISAQLILAELYIKNDMSARALDIYQKYANHPFMTRSLSPSNARAMQYNYGLAFVRLGQYKEALALFQKMNCHGYSMQLAILSHLKDFQAIRTLADSAGSYYLSQIADMLSHYDEELLYTHMSELQYHINLTLDAWIHAGVDAQKTYSYLLNTKYLSLETSWLIENSIPRYEATQVMQALPADTLLLEYTISYSLEGSSYTVFLVSAKEIHTISLGACESIDQLVTDYCTLIETSRDKDGSDLSCAAQYRMLNSMFRKRLYQPVQSIVERYEHLILAPAGGLIQFPFALLSTSAKGMLCDTHTLVYCNCGKELINHKVLTSSYYYDAPLIIGAPLAFSMSTLPYAAKEADFVANLFPDVPVYIGEDANIHLFKPDSINAYDLLHIAAHGIFSPDADIPRFGQADWNSLKQQLSESGLLLAGDQLLSCDMIAKLPLSNLKLAVLSSCHSGDSSYRTTEGAYGLRRAMIQAGCSFLLVNLWQIDDEISLTFTKFFYEALIHQSCTPKEAFHRTILALKETLPPYYWAGYQLIL